MDPKMALLWKRSLISCGLIIGSGVLLFKYTTPTEEQLIARLSPELRADYEKNKELRRQEQKELMEIVKKTSASNDPIWKTGSLQSPWERTDLQNQKLDESNVLFGKGSSGIESPLVKKDRFERDQAESKQHEMLEKMKKELESTEMIEKNSKNSKSWWKLW
ncbi:hypothetical protein B5S31_g5455 [[Candida] boidinii]|nr:hypothetical protein B5S31_g5455 [[Candida] boidinii]OWB79998.1 hypothetical protein B5S32_g4243 [[Candida] boidinii]